MAGYWMNETTGVLRPAIEAYLHDLPMSFDQIAALRGYLRQWINDPMWVGDDIKVLRWMVDGLTSQAAISAWLDRALKAGIDPL